MGGCLSKLAEEGGEIITPEMLERVKDKLNDSLSEFPELFKDEKRDIAWEMWSKAPR